MNEVVLHSFLDELSKTAGLRELWDNIREIMPSVQRAKSDVDTHFKSSDPHKYDKLITMAANNPEVIRQVGRHPDANPKLVQHLTAMVQLKKAPAVGKVDSTESGSHYEVRKLPGGALGCTCNDWRFRGSTKADYKCKHIKAYEAGHTKTGSFTDTTMAFFDEIGRMNRIRLKRIGDHYDSHDRPFSNLLTQDEEPLDYNPRPAAPIDEPEIIIGATR